MGKLTLNLDALQVDGFTTVAESSNARENAATIRCTTTCTEIGSCGHICP